ncbi:MAG: hypothetical protein WC889_05565 [Myxococcota bacterium]|jgi:hypothetical protein
MTSKRLSVLVAMVAAVVLSYGCGASCTGGYATDTLPVGSSWSVGYVVTATGTGTLASVQYTDATGATQQEMITGQNWVKDVSSVPGGTVVTLSFKGSPGTGELTAKILSQQGGAQREVSSSCSGN